MTKQQLLDRMAAWYPCEPALEWIVVQQTDSASELYDTCPNGSWLLWLAWHCNADRKLLVKAACLCARTSLDLVPAGEARPRIAIEKAEAWTKDREAPWNVASAADNANDSNLLAREWPVRDAIDAAIYAADAVSGNDGRCASTAAFLAGKAKQDANAQEIVDIVRSVIKWQDLQWSDLPGSEE